MLLGTIVGWAILAPLAKNKDWAPGKITQFIFAILIPRSHPNAILINLVTGALTEAAACQAGEMMFDLKVAREVGAAPLTQLYGQIIGSASGAIVSSILYKLYSSVYPVPGSMFQAPAAYIWVSAAKLALGTGLPKNAAAFSVGFGIFFALASVVKMRFVDRSWQQFIPSGVAFAVGIYNVPSFTLARVIGGLIAWLWSYLDKDEALLTSSASGLIIGEGLTGLLNMGLAAMQTDSLSTAR
ncbi:MAG: hypothetical protein Q9195_004979 [Heterodermia aff. obscurata]